MMMRDSGLLFGPPCSVARTVHELCRNVTYDRTTMRPKPRSRPCYVRRYSSTICRSFSFAWDKGILCHFCLFWPRKPIQYSLRV